jgi:hypothetical protein
LHAITCCSTSLIPFLNYIIGDRPKVCLLTASIRGFFSTSGKAVK